MIQEDADVGLLLPNSEVKLERIAGVDEVGKGAIFGPVFAGAIILDNQSEKILINAGVKDSKKLSAKRRTSLVPIIKRISKNWALGQASAREIDSLGIRIATEKAMIRAIHKLNAKPELLLIDGSLPLRLWEGKQTSLIKGEEKSISIAAASVLAKVARDELIKRLARKYPFYGLERHMGYGTTFHREKLLETGSTKLHRQSFLSKIK